MTDRSWGAFFGEPWPSGICDDGIRVPTPVGEKCAQCQQKIEAGDQGSFMGDDGGLVPSHRECSLRVVLGGIGHHLDHGHWCVEMHDPDGGMTYRESALAVWKLING